MLYIGCSLVLICYLNKYIPIIFNVSSKVMKVNLNANPNKGKMQHVSKQINHFKSLKIIL